MGPNWKDRASPDSFSGAFEVDDGAIAQVDLAHRPLKLDQLQIVDVRALENTILTTP